MTVVTRIWQPDWRDRISQLRQSTEDLAASIDPLLTSIREAPRAPTLTAGTATATTVPLSWTPDDTAGAAAVTHWQYRYRQLAGAWTDWADATTVGTNSYTVTGLATSVTFQLQVRGRAGTVTGALSNIVEATTVGKPAKPVGVSAVAEGPTKIRVSWSAGTSANPITSWVVDLDGTPGFMTTVSDSTARSVTLTGLSASRSYRVRVQARNSAGRGLWSEWVTVTTDDGLPYAPLGVNASGITTTMADIEWESGGAPSGITISGWQYRRTPGGVDWIDLGADVNRVQLRGLTAGTDYTVDVRGKSVHGSGPAASDTFTTFAIPTAPQNLTAQIIPGGFRVNALRYSWSAPANSADTGRLTYEVRLVVWRTNPNAFGYPQGWTGRDEWSEVDQRTYAAMRGWITGTATTPPSAAFVELARQQRGGLSTLGDPRVAPTALTRLYSYWPADSADWFDMGVSVATPNLLIEVISYRRAVPAVLPAPQGSTSTGPGQDAWIVWFQVRAVSPYAKSPVAQTGGWWIV